MKPTVNLEATVKHLKLHGPDRVMVSLGQAASSAQKAAAKGIVPEIIFIRDDGWTLGAPRSLEEVAYKTWAGLWIAFVEPPDFTAKPIAEYVPYR